MCEDATFNKQIEAVSKKVRHKTEWVLTTIYGRTQDNPDRIS